MVDISLFPKLVDYASLQLTDVVLEVGSGFGFLSQLLSKKCRKVLAIEKDKRIVPILREQLGNVGNVQILEGDVLKVVIPDFDKVVSIPPYQISSDLLLWLFSRRFDCAVCIFQREFANRLVASVGTEDYSWLTVFTHHYAQVDLFDPVPKYLFFPQPAVDSIIVRLIKRKPIPLCMKDAAFFRQMLRFLFANRNKKVANAMLPFVRSALEVSELEAKKLVNALPFRDRRVRTLTPENFEELASILAK